MTLFVFSSVLSWIDGALIPRKMKRKGKHPFDAGRSEGGAEGSAGSAHLKSRPQLARHRMRIRLDPTLGWSFLVTPGPLRFGSRNSGSGSCRTSSSSSTAGSRSRLLRGSGPEGQRPPAIERRVRGGSFVLMTSKWRVGRRDIVEGLSVRVAAATGSQHGRRLRASVCRLPSENARLSGMAPYPGAYG